MHVSQAVASHMRWTSLPLMKTVDGTLGVCDEKQSASVQVGIQYSISVLNGPNWITGVTLPTSEEPPEPAAPINIASIPEGDGDVKPKLAKAPEYAWDGAPALPDPWTYKPDLVPPPPPPSSKVTAGVLEFMKLTASERGDIPAELGLVDYRRADTREGRKKWGVKGIGAA